MEVFLQLIVVTLLILIIYQDYKFRAVSWIIFPLLLSGFSIFNILSNPITEILNNSLVNFCFVIFLFGLITIYFSVKHKKLINLSNGFIGWGDILFIFCLGFLFSPLNFIMFYSLSMIFIVAGVLLSRWILKNKSDNIPLAGMQAFLLLILFIINTAFPFFKYSTDEWLVNVLMS